MATVDILRMIAVSMAFSTAAFSLPAAVAAIRRMRAASHLEQTALSGRGGFLGRLLRNGVAPATRVIHVLCLVSRRIGVYCEDVRWLAEHRGFGTDAERAGGVVLVVAGTVVVLGWLASNSPVFGFVAAMCVIAGLGIASHQAHEHQADQMREALPDTLHAMSACFHAGYSLLQAFRYLSRELHGPLADLFDRAASDLETGSTAAEALRRMREDASLSELAFVTAALEIQHQTGGSLQKIIDSACESIEGELALKRSLRVQTAQARLSMRIVTMMPFILIAVFSFVSPDFLMPFFSSLLGLAVFCVAMGMQAAGVLIVRRLLDVKEA